MFAQAKGAFFNCHPKAEYPHIFVNNVVSVSLPGLSRAKSEESPASGPSVQGGVVLRRSSQSSTSSLSKRASTGSLPRSTELPTSGNPSPQTPHRVSWIEDGLWLHPVHRPYSLLQPPSPELDSLSISSIEEEPEDQSPSPTKQNPSAHAFLPPHTHTANVLN